MSVVSQSNKQMLFEKGVDHESKKLTQNMSEITKDISFKNLVESSPTISKIGPPQKEEIQEPSNVWASLRKIKETNTPCETIFGSNSKPAAEVVSLNDIDDMIQNLAQQIAQTRVSKQTDNLDTVKEESKEEINFESPSVISEMGGRKPGLRLIEQVIGLLNSQISDHLNLWRGDPK